MHAYINMYSIFECTLYNIKAMTWLQVIDFEVPITVKLTVVDVDPGLRGDTAQGKCYLVFF